MNVWRLAKPATILGIAGLMLALTAAPAMAATGTVLLRTGSEPNALCTTTSAGTVSIDVQVASLSDAINGVQVLFNYDNTLLTLNSGATSEATGWLRVALTDSSGDVTYALIKTTGGPVGPGAGPYTVATLVFDIVTQGSDTVDFRADDPPFYTRLIVAADNSIIQGGDLTKTDSGTISIDDTTATASSNSPVCEGSTINLYGGITGSSPVGPYTYAWTGPNGFNSSDEDPTIPSATTAMAGTYSLTVTNAAGCTFGPVTTDVAVQAAPIADAGVDQTVCETGTVQLAGSATYASSTLWSTSGTGTFDDASLLNAVYTPSGADITAGTVTLTLTANATAPCTGSDTDDMDVTIQYSPIADAGVDQSICGDETVQLAGSASNYVTVTWSGGGGSYDPNANALDAIYTPSATEITAGTVTLTLTATPLSPCSGDATDDVVITIQPCINVNIDITGLTVGTVDRLVTFVVTSCPSPTEQFDETVTFVPNVTVGEGSAKLTNVRADAEWLAVREGHTLRKLAAVAGNFSTTKTDTISVTLTQGDFQTGALYGGVVQDNLVDILDFSVLATRWESNVYDCDDDSGTADPDCGMGADVDGDGFQNGADFSVIQPNFFVVGDAEHGCTKFGYPGGGFDNDLRAEVQTHKASIRLSELSLMLPNADEADINGDGVVDARDIRAFAERHDLWLMPEFDAKLSELELELNVEQEVERATPLSTGRR